MGSYSGEVGPLTRSKSIASTDHFPVDKTTLRFLPGVVVSCGEFWFFGVCFGVQGWVSYGFKSVKVGFFVVENMDKTWF